MRLTSTGGESPYDSLASHQHLSSLQTRHVGWPSLCHFSCTTGGKFLTCGTRAYWTPWLLKTRATLLNLCLSEWYIPTYVPTPVANLYYYVYRLMKALLHDLRSMITPVYTILLKRLVPVLLRKLEPVALGELLATLVALFKY